MRVLTFNADTDYALASAMPGYTAPGSVVALMERMAMLPCSYAQSGDVVVPYNNIHRLGDIVKSLGGRMEDVVLIPWGWNASIRHRLLKAGVPPSNLPSEEYIARLRELSHRRLTIGANIFLNKILSKSDELRRHRAPLPLELRSISEVELLLADPQSCFSYDQEGKILSEDTGGGYANRGGYCGLYFKAPWSSSGRGVLYTGGAQDEQIPFEKILKWCNGIISRQGSVMCELGASRVADFATEWIADGEGGVRFMGYSFFRASFRGKYQGNICGSQREILSEIRRYAPDFGDWVVSVQSEMLSKAIGEYKGPLGVDMLCDTEGHIRCCVEINLRMTMGMAALVQSLKF